ncbi:helix-turn-helix domain-containing protein [Kitasatospora sp. NPDC006697]|uniref:helix-turn-helix domain-containing protein n=1 Tax=Kitasatospora sp. NPDC006697 TaxID=3364020 RepID=UPI003693666F
MITTPIDESVRARPAAALRPYVAWYSGYRQAGVAPAVHRGLPSPYLTLILTLDDPLTLAAHPDPAQPPGEYRTLLGGLHTTPALITHQGAQSGVQIAVSPLGARTLFGLPAGELAGADYPAEEVLGRWAAEGQERVRGARGWPGRFRALDGWLLQRAAEAAAPPPEVVRAWQLLLASRGLAGAARLAAEVGWSTRHLAARFHTEIGLTPKTAGRVIRFDRARRLLTAPGAPPLAALAAGCGYFDQSHLAREFNALAGCPPSRYRVEEPQRAG